MKTKFLGDLHAEKYEIREYKKDTIQIGDLDLFGYDWWAWQFSTPEEWKNAYKDSPVEMKDYPRFNSPPVIPGRRFFIDGNHDYLPCLDLNANEPYYIRPNLVYIPRGYVSGKVMFIGGAESIDKSSRIPHVSWFPEENFTYDQQNRILSYEGEIEVIVSHDCPISAAAEVLRPSGWKPMGFSSSIFLEEVWKKFKPKLYIFGHFHKPYEFDLKGDGFSTKFTCCNIAQVKEYDVPLAPDFFTRDWEKRYGNDITRLSEIITPLRFQCPELFQHPE